LSKKQEDGTWLTKCPLCTWKETSQTKVEAENNLNNHVNKVHQEGRGKKVKPAKPVRTAKAMPPQLPTPIKENK
jgi:hypothetical protein